MTPAYEIRRIRESDAPALRELRLSALRSDPLAFGSTEARESAYADEHWASWARRGAGDLQEATFVAEEPPGPLVGMIGIFSKDGHPQLWGMWVRPTHRGRGIGSRLVDTVLEWAGRAFPDVPVQLEVNPEQWDAVRIYRTRGFEFTGFEEPLGHHAPAIVRAMSRPAGGRAGSPAEPRKSEAP
jgi:ribosomal protein S18 acetylase RimI-like enzyme